MSEGMENDVSAPGLSAVEMSRDGPTRETPPPATDIQEPSDVLLLGPIWRSVDDAACAGRFASAEARDANILLVTLTEPADERVGVLQNHLEDPPSRIRVVSASDEHTSDVSIAGPSGEMTLSIYAVDDPSDLPRLGMRIQEAAAFEDDRPTLVCFHSLTALLQYADTQRVFRFLHIMQNAIDAETHYHMDANSHNTRTVETLKQLFDAVIEFDGEGNEIVTR